LFRQVLADAAETLAESNDAFTRRREGRARRLIDEALSFVTVTSIREVVSKRDRKIDEYTGSLERANHELALKQRLVSGVTNRGAFGRLAGCIARLRVDYLLDDRERAVAHTARGHCGKPLWIRIEPGLRVPAACRGEDDPFVAAVGLPKNHSVDGSSAPIAQSSVALARQ
jgi:hypothetical protein